MLAKSLWKYVEDTDLSAEQKTRGPSDSRCYWCPHSCEAHEAQATHVTLIDQTVNVGKGVGWRA